MRLLDRASVCSTHLNVVHSTIRNHALYACTLLVSIALAGPAVAQESQQTFRQFYGMVYGGVATPTGSVDDMGGVVTFPSTPAGDIYEPGVVIGIFSRGRTIRMACGACL